MSRLKIGTTVNGSPAHLDIETLRTSHLLIQGASGSGKSYLLRVLAEGFCQEIPTIIIDPEGEYHTLRQKFPFVLVGEGGETPARVETAAKLAAKLVEVGASAICDLYALEKGQREQWVAEFLAAMLRLPREQWRPLVVMLDEAHLFAPEKGEGSAASTKAVEDFASRCRKRGIGLVVATQRITKISNNVVSECQNYFIGRTFIQTDRERAAKALGVPNRSAEREEFFGDLKVLKKGEFWALGVAVADERIPVSVSKAQTVHLEPGTQSNAHKPPTPEEIRALLPQFADLPKQVEEETNLVDSLKEQLVSKGMEIADLGQEVAAMRSEWEVREAYWQGEIKRAMEAAGGKEKLAKVWGYRAGYQAGWLKLMEQVRAVIDGKAPVLDEIAIPPAWTTELPAEFGKMPEMPPAVAEFGRKFEALGRPVSEAPPGVLPDRFGQMVFHDRAIQKVGEPDNVVSKYPKTPTQVAHQNGLSRPQVDLLRALAEAEALGHHAGISRSWMAFLAGVSSKSSGFEKNVSTLRTGGYIDYPSQGKVCLSAQGRNFTRENNLASGRPRSTSEMIARVCQLISGPQGDLLKVLVRTYPKSLSREQLAELAGVSSKSSGFEKNVSTLSSRELTTYPSPGQVRAADWLFLK